MMTEGKNPLPSRGSTTPHSQCPHSVGELEINKSTTNQPSTNHCAVSSRASQLTTHARIKRQLSMCLNIVTTDRPSFPSPFIHHSTE